MKKNKTVKKNETVKNILLALRYMKERKAAYMANSIGLAGTDAVYHVLVAFAMKDIVDAAITGNTTLLIRGIIIIVLGAVGIFVVYKYCNYKLVTCANQTLAKDIQFRFTHRAFQS